jgi:hypothetical protein
MKWNYKVIALTDDAQTTAKELNILGSAGWELITIQGDEKVRHAYLKSEAVEPRQKIKL